MSCNRPWEYTTKDGRKLMLPCGWCTQCRIDRREEWIMRLTMETKNGNGAFVTLTYNDKNYHESVEKAELQHFFKKMRNNGWKGKYYAVGEYGEIGGEENRYGDGIGRAHYHAIITGIDPVQAIAETNKAWKKGYIKVGGVTHASIRYVLKYIEKQWIGRKQPEIYKGRKPPFCIMSKGIGRKWLEENIQNIEENGLYFRGKKVPIPRYYKKISGLKEQTNEERTQKILEYAKNKAISPKEAQTKLGEIQDAELIAKTNLIGYI